MLSIIATRVALRYAILGVGLALAAHFIVSAQVRLQ